MKSLPVPNPMANPIAQNIRKAIERLMRIFPITAPEFFIRDSPTSSIANPACMNRTRVAPMNTRSELTAMSVGVGLPCERANAGTSSSITAASTGTSRNDLKRIYSPCAW